MVNYVNHAFSNSEQIGGPVSLNGIIEINGNVTFSGDFTMGPNSKITINPNSTLTLISANLFACDNYMWEGIILTDNSSKIKTYLDGGQTHSSISDAELAIDASNEGLIEVSNTYKLILQKNYKGIVLNNNGQSYAYDLDGLTIRCTDDLLNYVNLLPPHQTERSYSGIELIDVAGINQYVNICYNLENALIAINSDMALDVFRAYDCNVGISAISNDGDQHQLDLTRHGNPVANSRFYRCGIGIRIENMNMNVNDAYSEDCNNTIHAISNNGLQHNLTVTNVLANPNPLHKFKNSLSSAIIIKDMNATIENCRMEDCYIGVQYSGCFAKYLAIVDNTITNTTPGLSSNTYIGIYGSMSPYSFTEISNNIIETGSQVNSAAIRVFNNPALPGYTFVNDNEITTYGSYGIHLIGAGQYISAGQSGIWLNTIEMHPMVGTQPHSGIRLEHGYENYIECNLVDGLSGYEPQRGISAAFAPLTNVNCNTTDQTIRGIDFAADCNYSLVYGNTYKDHDDGLVLGAVISGGIIPGVLGDQTLPNGTNTPGNIYQGDGAGAFIHASTFSIQSDADFYDFWATSPGLLWPNLNAFIGGGASSSFNPTPQPGYSPYACPQECQNLQLSPFISVSSAEAVATDVMTLSSGNDLIARSLEGNLYMRLMREDSALLDSSAVIADFADSLSGTTTGKIADVALAISSIYDSSGGEMNDSVITARIAATKTLNNSVEPKTDYELARKIVNTIVLNSVAARRFVLNDNEADSLLDVAAQCPYIAGTAVFEARALYSLYDPDTFFVDDSLCGDLPEDTCLYSVPAAPGSISGYTTGLCGADSVSYSVTPVSGASSYLWAASNGAVVNAPATLSSVTISFPDSFIYSNIFVMAVNACGTGNPRKLTTHSAPAAPGAVSGNDTVCGGGVEEYSTSGSSGATSYNWTVPGDATILSGQGTSSVLVLWGSQSGAIALNASNDCDTSNNVNLNVVVNTCRKAFNHEISGLDATEVYPNPTTGSLTIKFKITEDSYFEIKLTDFAGRSLATVQGKCQKGVNYRLLDLSALSRGIYFLNLQARDKNEMIRVTIQ